MVYHLTMRKCPIIYKTQTSLYEADKFITNCLKQLHQIQMSNGRFHVAYLDELLDIIILQQYMMEDELQK